MKLIPLLLLLPIIASAQKYVAYDGALMYADADYLSTVVDTLRLGDTVAVLAREKRFAQIRIGTREGWVLVANLSDRAPRVAKAPSDTASKREAPPATIDTPRASCAGLTKTGKQCSRKATEGSSYCWQHRR